MKAPICKQHTENATDEAEQRALGQTLPHKPSAARSEGHPHRQLPLAGNRARQHQARYVGARDRQYEPDSAQK